MTCGKFLYLPLPSKFKPYNMTVASLSNPKVNLKIKYSGLKSIDFFCK